jgi:hypothetical protein
MVILDNSTRWNSTYLSLQRALQLKTRLRAFCLEDGYAEELSKDLLTDEDWQQLAEIADGLKVFWQATKRVEGNAQRGSHGSIWEVLPLIEALQGVLEEGLRRYNPDRLQELLSVHTPSTRQPATQRRRGNARSQNSTPAEDSSSTAIPHLAIAYQNAWEKLRKYYNLTDVSHEIYAAAVLFHPSLRQRYFDIHWVTESLAEWKTIMISNVKKHYEKEYPVEQQVLEERPKKKVREPDFLDIFLRQGVTTTSQPSDRDVFDTYITGEPTIFNEDDKDAVFPWWRNSGPEQLCRRALDLLSIPAMSSEIERIFSTTKRLIIADRNQLNPETIEHLTLLKYWYQNDIVKEKSIALEAIKRPTFGLEEAAAR